MSLGLYAIYRTAPDYDEDKLAIVAAKDESEARILAGRASYDSYAFSWCDPKTATCEHIGAAADKYTEPTLIKMG